ncbi:Cadherin-23 [Schistosoma japonicum]|uniref:Cadherin-23 n=1 Tax=Schistosoma japonicum TaxID=6182 RepID=A0A4Z2D166_SCHJA|nr:Cadherin-23 [Schistosoma japonicum]
MNIYSIGIEILTINIQLIDINDNYPIFQSFNKYEINFMEDDLTKTKTSQQNILEIYLNDALDREQQDKYDLYLLAIDNHYRIEDKRHTTTLPLTIHIHDVNDCKPKFILPKINNDSIWIEIPENTPIGHVVTRFHAVDEDIGKNGEIHYSISQYTHSLTKSVN